MFEEVQAEERRDVALASSAAAAEFVAATLAVHGVRASTAVFDRVHPSLDWVHGYRVTVVIEDEELAREILASLEGRDDVIPPPADWPD